MSESTDVPVVVADVDCSRAADLQPAKRRRVGHRYRGPSPAEGPEAVDPVTLIAIVFSPLQALNLHEYSQRFDLEVDVVVVGHASALETTTRTQIEAMLSLIAPRKIFYHEWLLRPRRPMGARGALTSGVATLRAHLSTGPYEVVVGDYRSAFSWAVLHCLKALACRIVVVDDGTATLRIDRRRSLWRSRQEWGEKCKSLIFLAFGIRGVVPPPGLTFFTTYALDDHVAAADVVVHNDYRTLSAELLKLPPDDDSVYVIGSPFREAGVVDEGDIELALELTRFAAESTGKEAVYMAHRRERAEKLDAVREEFRVVTPDVPFEVYPQVLGKRPRTIVGYYSSLFVTVAELWGDSVEIIAVKLPRGSVNDSSVAFIEDVYRYYRTELGSIVRVVEPQMPSPARPTDDGERS